MLAWLSDLNWWGAFGGICAGGLVIWLVRNDMKKSSYKPQVPRRLTAKEILAVMTPVTVLPPRDARFTPYSKPLRIGRLLENGDFEMYCDELFVRYRFDDGAYVKLEQGGMSAHRIEFNATHWQSI